MTHAKSTVYRSALRSGAATMALGFGLIASQAFAQDATQTAQAAEAAAEETIVVTGSRIARPDLEAASPVSVIGAEEFTLSNAVNVEEVLFELPQVIPSFGAASNNPGDGSAQVDLRGLGAARTLVLVNGRRYISYDVTGIVDLNTVPSGLVERVEVVTGGKSAIYGSDAIAGVVNFVLKDDFEGASIEASNRITEEGDGQTFQVNATIGTNFADDRGNVTVYAQYTDRDAIFQRDREFSSFTLSGDGDGGTFLGGSGSVPGLRANFGAGNRLFLQDGSYRPYNGATDAFNFAPDNYLQVPQERWFIGGFANYEVSNNLELYMETQFVNNRVVQQLASTPITALSSQPLQVDIDSPFLAPSVQADLAALDTDGNGLVTLANFGRRMQEVGPRISDNDRNAFRGLAGARGEIAAGWQYDAYYSFARTNNLEQQSGNVSRSRFNAAVATQFDADGNLVCATGAPAGCVPINIFGPGNISPEGAAYISVDTKNSTRITSQVAQAVVSNGELFDLGLGAAPVGIALGVEWRSERGEFNPDFILASGDVVGFNAGTPTEGRYSVKEVFGELVIPILADRPGFHLLELNGAIRLSDYSNNVGSTTAWSAGGQWAPIEDITFRGQYQRAVRAPSISALFLGQSEGFPGFQDICREPDALSGTLRQSCIDNGVPAAVVGTEFGSGNAQVRAIFGGNPDLKEETSDTYTIGAIITPRFAPRLSITVDYYNIEIKDAILAAGPGVTAIRDACFGTEANGYTPYDTSFCNLIQRDATGEIEEITNTNLNAGFFKTEGVDFEIRYGMDLGFGMDNSSNLSFRLSGTYLLDYTVNNLAAIPDLVQTCDGKYGAFCGDPFSEWRGSMRITYATGPFTASALINYIGEADDDGQSGATPSVTHLGAETYLDLTFGWQATERLNLTFGIDNVLDEEPPLLDDLNNQQANTFPSTYDPYGRRFFVAARFDF